MVIESSFGGGGRLVQQVELRKGSRTWLGEICFRGWEVEFWNFQILITKVSTVARAYSESHLRMIRSESGLYKSDTPVLWLYIVVCVSVWSGREFSRTCCVEILTSLRSSTTEDGAGSWSSRAWFGLGLIEEQMQPHHWTHFQVWRGDVFCLDTNPSDTAALMTLHPCKTSWSIRSDAS